MVRIASTSSCIRRNKKLPFLQLSLCLSLCLSVPLSFCRSLSLYVFIQRESTTCCDTSTCVSSGRCSSMLRRFHYYMCPHTTTCVLILRYMPPHTTYACPHTSVCVLILLYVCPHTTVYVSSYYYMCILILLCMCPHTTDENDCDMHVSTYYWMCVLVPPAYCFNVSSCYHYIWVHMPQLLLYMCPHT
jgi:hypothetical protein